MKILVRKSDRIPFYILVDRECKFKQIIGLLSDDASIDKMWEGGVVALKDYPREDYEIVDIDVYGDIEQGTILFEGVDKKKKEEILLVNFMVWYIQYFDAVVNGRIDGYVNLGGVVEAYQIFKETGEWYPVLEIEK